MHTLVAFHSLPLRLRDLRLLLYVQMLSNSCFHVQ